MHNGSLASLHDVVRLYSELNEDRLHSDGERILKPLRLDPGETDDLVAFLTTLSDAKTGFVRRAGTTDLPCR
jgi:cytochrome c peroxidase